MRTIVALATVAFLASAIQAGTVTPSLQMRLDKGESLDISIYLESTSDVFTSQSLMTLEGEARVQNMISTLKTRTAASQKPFLNVLNQLKKRATEVATLWAANFIRVEKADKALVAALAAVPGQFTIREPIVVSLIKPTEVSNITIMKQGVQWGVRMVEAEKAWTATRGEGAVVGVIDTGAYLGHNALKDNYGGAWYDPIFGTTEPEDTYGHGTHSLGSAVGTANGIGVAPGAKWIACRGFHTGAGYDAQLLKCGEWMLSVNPRPHVVSNSWLVGKDDPWYSDVVSAWRAANIVPVFAFANHGPGCQTGLSPGDQPGLIGVGATNSLDEVAYFSSRGPTLSGLQKPDISAPGADIVSAGISGPDSYVTMSGTSMAAPHVAGAIALYISKNPRATYDQVYKAITQSGAKPTVSNDDRACGTTEWPNMGFGHGRLNAAALVRA